MSSKASCHDDLDVLVGGRVPAHRRGQAAGGSRARGRVQPSSSVSVCCAKNSGVQRSVVSSQAVALAPCSQNSAGVRLGRLGPRAADAGEAVGLVLLEQDARAVEPDVRLAQRVRHLLDGRPAAGGVRERFDADVFVLGHGGVSVESAIRSSGKARAPRIVSGRCKTSRSRATVGARAHRRAPARLEPPVDNPPTSAAPAPGQQPDPNRAYQMFPVLTRRRRASACAASASRTTSRTARS